MRRISGLCAAVIVLLGAGAAAQAAEEPVRMVLSKKVFTMHKPEDVMAQAQEVADEVGERIGRKVCVETRSEEISAVLDDLKSGKVQFVFSDGLDFARLKLGKLAPGVVGPPMDVRLVVGCASPVDTVGQKPGLTRGIVLVKNDSKISGMADLKGKRLVYGRQSEMDCSMILLEKALRRLGAARKEDFFGNVRRLSCEDACLIALQRGSADATCMVEDTLLARYSVTPGIMRDFKVLEASEFYASYICFYLNGRTPEDLVEKMRAQLLELHQTTKGRMLLDLFMCEGFVRMPEESTKPVEELLRIVEP